MSLLYLPSDPLDRISYQTDLHYKVEFIRTNYPDIVLLPGLGQYQKTSDLRKDAWSKGYIGGQPDVVILNSHKTLNGFALELKTPNGNGVLSDKQSAYLTKLNNKTTRHWSAITTTRS